MLAGICRASVKTYCYFCLNTTEIWMCQLVLAKISNLEILIKFVQRFAILENDQLDTSYTLALFYNTFIIILYMSRVLYAHHQEVELY